ncbi:hypothetical protein B0H14DRAFT_2763912, partial [Mycena olivaceomarginata]
MPQLHYLQRVTVLLFAFSGFWAAVTLVFAISVPEAIISRPFQVASRIYGICSFICVIALAFRAYVAHRQSLDLIPTFLRWLCVYALVLLACTTFMLVVLFRPRAVYPIT